MTFFLIINSKFVLIKVGNHFILCFQELGDVCYWENLCAVLNLIPNSNKIESSSKNLKTLALGNQ